MIKNLTYQLIHFYEVFISFFSVAFILIYISLSLLSYYAILKHLRYQKFISEDILTRSNHLLGVSIVAPAFNEGVNIVKKHQKSRVSGAKGTIVEKSLPIHASNVKKV